MKKILIISSVWIIAFLGLVILHNYFFTRQITVFAQTPVCPTTYNNNARWVKNNNVRLRIHSAFTATERQSIIDAFNEWNNNRVVNCSNVTFDTNTITIADGQATSPT